MRHELNCRLKLVQLIGDNAWKGAESDFDALRTPEGLRQIATYADGIGPSLRHIVRGRDDQGRPLMTDLVPQAHAQRLVVHPYTMRADALPKYVQGFDELMRLFFHEAKVDGVFTDFPDQAVRFLRR